MIKNETVLSAYKMISFDACSLFTVVPLDYTIDLTLKRIYGDKKIENNISRKDWKNLLLLSTKICCYYVPKTFISLSKIKFANKKMVLPWDLHLVQCREEFLWYIWKEH